MINCKQHKEGDISHLVGFIKLKVKKCKIAKPKYFVL